MSVTPSEHITVVQSWARNDETSRYYNRGEKFVRLCCCCWPCDAIKCVRCCCWPLNDIICTVPVWWRLIRIDVAAHMHVGRPCQCVPIRDQTATLLYPITIFIYLLRDEDKIPFYSNVIQMIKENNPSIKKRKKRNENSKLIPSRVAGRYCV